MQQLLRRCACRGSPLLSRSPCPPSQFARLSSSSAGGTGSSSTVFDGGKFAAEQFTRLPRWEGGSRGARVSQLYGSAARWEQGKQLRTREFGSTKQWKTLSTREAMDVYLLRQRDLKGLTFVTKYNVYGTPRLTMFYVQFDVQDRALVRWGSAEQLAAEHRRRQAKRERRIARLQPPVLMLLRPVRARKGVVVVGSRALGTAMLGNLGVLAAKLAGWGATGSGAMLSEVLICPPMLRLLRLFLLSEVLFCPPMLRLLRLFLLSEVFCTLLRLSRLSLRYGYHGCYVCHSCYDCQGCHGCYGCYDCYDCSCSRRCSTRSPTSATSACSPSGYSNRSARRTPHARTATASSSTSGR